MRVFVLISIIVLSACCNCKTEQIIKDNEELIIPNDFNKI